MFMLQIVIKCVNFEEDIDTSQQTDRSTNLGKLRVRIFGTCFFVFHVLFWTTELMYKITVRIYLLGLEQKLFSF